MKIYESGRESKLLDDIKAGRKTIEVRLNRDKFAEYKSGDRVWLREDFYQEGQIIKSKPKQVLVEITRVKKYKSFRDLMEGSGFRNVIPAAKMIDEAVYDTYRFYSSADENKYGVLAIYFKVLKLNNDAAAEAGGTAINHR